MHGAATSGRSHWAGLTAPRAPVAAARASFDPELVERGLQRLHVGLAREGRSRDAVYVGALGLQSLAVELRLGDRS